MASLPFHSKYLIAATVFWKTSYYCNFLTFEKYNEIDFFIKKNTSQHLLLLCSANMNVNK